VDASGKKPCFSSVKEPEELAYLRMIISASRRAREDRLEVLIEAPTRKPGAMREKRT
jgi:hypothetical protein